jgi:predicted DsbA family dithiol-disulfide isomerase
MNVGSGVVASRWNAVVWADYICPWCYAGLDRTALLESRGVDVRHRPYELHPEIPADGIDLTAARPGGRTDALYSRLEAECRSTGLPFRRPERIPPSRLALETSVVVGRTDPAAAHALDRLLYSAHFAEGRAIDDPEVLAELVERAGADAGAVMGDVAAGLGSAEVDRSREDATDAGATGTPTWLIERRILIPGLVSRAHIERVVSRL